MPLSNLSRLFAHFLSSGRLRPRKPCLLLEDARQTPCIKLAKAAEYFFARILGASHVNMVLGKDSQDDRAYPPITAPQENAVPQADRQEAYQVEISLGTLKKIRYVQAIAVPPCQGYQARLGARLKTL